ncbi:hypothetical protein KXD96_28250 (plasmid) [Mycobacterium sp. SMC-2]|uniref:hypothetical protein n=1 Tax=Mycobacterium sp. SMC-2 TaxID=2857058 RepID=UPI0021B29136|nr:hypothetical protein [Mycobacterium sp. SMC-2]UXA06559.1 hypothetical protein KXD96_27725 [Mycobacterium sp. SMC-2]UXA09651.1 hypothetical protein KXD96_28250 [Mycobacterium sp. SMC-2]
MADQLHYRGDHRQFDPDNIVGPDQFGAFYRAVAAEYDAEADRTALHLQVVPPAELQQRMLDALPTIQDVTTAAARIIGLFADA